MSANLKILLLFSDFKSGSLSLGRSRIQMTASRYGEKLRIYLINSHGQTKRHGCGAWGLGEGLKLLAVRIEHVKNRSERHRNLMRNLERTWLRTGTRGRVANAQLNILVSRISGNFVTVTNCSSLKNDLAPSSQLVNFL